MQVKICGVRTPEGARACARARADMAGINFVPGTKRAISPEEAKALLPLLGDTAPVGVFQNARLETILAVTEMLDIQWAQLHGDESPALCAALSRHLKVIKALDAAGALEEISSKRYTPHIARFLVDGRHPGSGQRWAWEAVAKLGGQIGGVPMFLAGGLTPENVKEAIITAHPAGVDTASGIEQHGAQDPARILAFCRSARGAQQRES